MEKASHCKKTPLSCFQLKAGLLLYCFRNRRKDRSISRLADFFLLQSFPLFCGLIHSLRAKARFKIDSPWISFLGSFQSCLWANSDNLEGRSAEYENCPAWLFPTIDAGYRRRRAKRRPTRRRGWPRRTTRRPGDRRISRPTRKLINKQAHPHVLVTHSDHFWTCVMRGSAAGLQHGPHRLQGSHTEVGDLDVVFVVQEEVLGFQITMTGKKTRAYS